MREREGGREGMVMKISEKKNGIWNIMVERNKHSQLS